MSDTYAQVMRSAEHSGTPGSGSAVFDDAVTAFRSGLDQVSDDVTIEDVPPPKRLAPHATAIAATAHRDGDEVATGRLVLLFDPAGNEGWCGTFRLVAFVHADIEPEVAADPLLGEVGWTWLIEALDMYTPGYVAESGTVTREITEGFGSKEEELPLTSFELRASWSPAGGPDLGGPDLNRASPDPASPDPASPDLADLDLGGHVLGWYACLRAAAGLEPPGTRSLPGTKGPGSNGPGSNGHGPGGGSRPHDPDRQKGQRRQ
jgi:DUF3000 family protein